LEETAKHLWILQQKLAGSAFPAKRVTNAELSEKLANLGVNTSDQWIRERTGICERRFSDIDNPDEHNSSLGLAAAQRALAMAGKTANEIDQIIYSTCTPDTLIPSTACWLQHKIGASRAWAMDINAACSGFVYGVAIADQFIRTGQVKTALVIGAEVLSSILNWEDRTSCIIFADGAGAAIVERVAKDSPQRILSSHFLSDGSFCELLHIPAGGSRLEITPERYSQKLHKLRMDGRKVFKIAVKTLVDFAVRALEENRMTIQELDWFVPHQANLRIIEAAADRLNLPMEKVLINIDRYANTSSATIPTVFDEAVRDGRIQKGQTVLFDTFGAGLTYGSMLLRW